MRLRLKSLVNFLLGFAVVYGFFLCLPSWAETRVTFKLENDTFQVATNAKSLGELFAELGLSLPGDYLAERGLDLEGKLRSVIELPMVFVNRLTFREEIPPDVSYKVYQTHGAGRVEIVSPGRNGVSLARYTIFTLGKTAVGGRLTRSVIVAPKPRVVAIYQQVPNTYIPEREDILRMGRLASREFRPPLRYKKVFEMEATAYSPENAKDSWGDPNSTAIGLKAGYGVVAVDPKVIPLGTRLYIEGYGYAVAGDVGGAIKGMRIDLGFDKEEEALKFGRRRVKVFMLD